MRRLKIIVATVVALGSVCTSLYAQESLIGKYSGTYTTTSVRKGGEIRIGVDLTISSVENGIVKGMTQRHAGPCKGEYPVEGTYKDDKLILKSSKGGPADDCTTSLQLVSEGNKLKGTLGRSPIELSK